MHGMKLLRKCLIGVVLLVVSFTRGFSQDLQGVLNLKELTDSQVSALKNNPGISLWIEMDESMFLIGDEKELANFQKSGFFKSLSKLVNPEQLYFASSGHHSELDHLPVDILLESGRKALIHWKASQKPRSGSDQRSRFIKVTQSEAFVRNLARNRYQKSSIALPEVAAELVAGVEGERWMDDVERLSGFNRYVASRDMPDVMDWLEGKFASLPGMTTSRQDFSIGSRQGSNIIAEILGSEPGAEIIVVGAHYDSISENPFVSAPGAEDNASGTAALLEMARIVSQKRPKQTIRFVAFSGEEQGLYGSKDYVRRLLAQGQKVRVALIMDMIGYTSDADLDCLLETSDQNQAVIDVLSEGAREFSSLRILSTFDYWGSDHVPFLRNNIPATLIIENDYASYPAYHRSGDLPELLSLSMGREVLKMNMAGLAYWAY